MTPEERIAVLEATVERSQKDVQELFQMNRDLYTFIREHMEKEEDRIDEIMKALTSYKGTIGGVILAFTGISAAIMFLVNLWGKIH